MINTITSRNNLPKREQLAIKQLKQNPDINIKRTDEGSSIVVLNKEDKIIEGQIQLDDREKYKPLETPMVIETSRRVKKLIQGETYRRDDKTMAIPHAKSTANTTILHSHKDSQTNTSWKTDHIGVRRPDGKNLIIC